jgi:uncharacterized integral membrane protein (TIGR00698 family)
VDVSSVADELAARPRSRFLLKPPPLLPGLLAALAVAGVAEPLGSLVPVVGAPVFALAIGAAGAALLGERPALKPGVAFASRTVLQGAIVVLGLSLSLTRVASVGGRSLPVMLGSLAAALLVAAVAGHLLRIGPVLRTLVGVGTGICGASAIAAVSGVVGAADAEMAYAVSTIFAFNIVAVVLFPLLGHLLGLSSHAYGLWAGTAVNDTSSVVAAAYAYGHAAGAYAVIVKLTRTTMIIPIVLVLAGLRLRRTGEHTERSLRRVVPWFLLWFLLAAGVNSMGLIGPSLGHDASQLGVALITVALAGVGLSTRFASLRSTGPRPLLLGALVWASVAISSLLLIWATG